MDLIIKNYLSRIGQKGGKRSRRNLSTDDARLMIQVREARRAYRNFYVSCFWSYDENYKIQREDIPWVVGQLRRHGGLKAWKVAEYLCR